MWRTCGLTRPWNDPIADIQRKLGVQRALFLVGEADGLVIASAMGGYDGHRGWVNYLAVHPEHQRKGCGQALMQRLENLLLALGCPKLNLQIRMGNDAALNFYRAIGFAQDEAVCYGKRLIRDEPAA